jgi:hypothetical protein
MKTINWRKPDLNDYVVETQTEIDFMKKGEQYVDKHIVWKKKMIRLRK